MEEQEDPGDRGDLAQEMDLEADLEEVWEEDRREIEECFDHALAEAEHVVEGVAQANPHVIDVGLAAGPDSETMALLTQQATHIIDSMGLDDEPEGAAHSGGAASSSSSAPPMPAPMPAQDAAPDPIDRLSGPSASGYVYDGTRCVMRIQRGKPARSVTISCYSHARCTMLLTEARCPDDRELFRWLLAVPRAPPGCPTSESRELAAQHMALGKGQWSARKRTLES